MYVRTYIDVPTYIEWYITLHNMGITQGCNKIGYEFKNELKNL